MIDPFIGKVSFVRVFSGEFHSDSEWYNRSKQEKSRVAHIGNEWKRAPIFPGQPADIVAVTKIENFETNDTVATEDGDPLVMPTHYPQPSIHMAIHAKNKNDEDKLGTALPKIISGDPSVYVERIYETHEIVLHGAGNLQLEMIANRLRKQFKLDVELTTPKVAYRETIMAQGEGRYRHKKQSGGRGQFAEVQMRLRLWGANSLNSLTVFSAVPFPVSSYPLWKKAYRKQWDADRGWLSGRGCLRGTL